MITELDRRAVDSPNTPSSVTNDNNVGCIHTKKQSEAKLTRRQGKASLSDGLNTDEEINRHEQLK